MLNYVIHLLLAISVTFSVHAATARPTPTLALLYDAVIPALEGGNSVVYMVPFDATGTDDTSLPMWWKACHATKQVSDKGMRQARAINQALGRLNAVIGVVHTSELCTAMTSATYVAGRARSQVYPTPDLDSPVIQNQMGLKDPVIQAKLAFVFRLRWVGTTTLMVGAKLTPDTAPHSVLTDLEPGDTAVFEVSDSGEIRLVARLTWQQWEEMGKYYLSKQPKSKRLAKR